MLIIISIFAFLATFLGGMFAIRFRDKMHLILGFSAGRSERRLNVIGRQERLGQTLTLIARSWLMRDIQKRKRSVTSFISRKWHSCARYPVT
jgi:hypothetical protein